MSAFIIADIDVKDPAAYQEYIAKVPQLVAKHGGSYRARGGPHIRFEGDWDPRRLVLLEFPDRAAAEAFYNDPAYADLKQLRKDSTETRLVLLEGI